MVQIECQFTIGFVGFGEAAFSIAKGLKGQGLDRIRAYDIAQGVEPSGGIIRARAKELAIPLDSSLKALIGSSDIVFTATSSATALTIAEQAAHFLDSETLYVDANAASPNAIERAAQLIGRSGGLFVDAAMMGPLPRYLHKVPILACGSGAASFEARLAPLGMNIRTIGIRPGKASAIKCFRSIYMKGAAALLYETCLAARRFDAVELIVESLSESFNNMPFEKWVDRLLNGTAIHAGRRIHEMEDVIATLGTIDIPATMSEATRAVLSWVNGFGLSEVFNGRTPNDFMEVLAAVEERMGENC